MAYYHSPKEYEAKTGKRFSDKGASIHRTGSVKGMVKLGYWDKDADKVRYGSSTFICKMILGKNYILRRYFNV